MSTFLVVSLILWHHFIADFVCQTDWMAKNKSSNYKALLAHVAVYTVVLGSGISSFFYFADVMPIDYTLVVFWALLNGILHGVVDFCTSRASSYFWSKGDTHNFFVVIGFDQFLHSITLIGTFIWIFT